MRVTLLFPPSLCLPNQMYYALPLLAGALRSAGHVPTCVDLNLACADRLTEPAMTEELLAVAEDMHRLALERNERRWASEVRRHVDNNAAIVRRGPAFKRALRTPASYYDRRSFHESFWGLVEVLAAFYALDPLVSPFRRDFRAAMRDNQQQDHWTVLTHLYGSGLVEQEILAHRPELIGVCLAFPEQAVECVRMLRQIRARAPGIPICVGGPLVTGFAEEWLGDGFLFDYCDYVCVGDGERTIVELCEAMAGKRRLEEVTNLCFRREDGSVHRPAERWLADLDEAPTPDFDSCDLARSFTPEPIYPLMLSRGCYWGKCTFCSIGWRENYRMAGKEKMRRDLETVIARGGRYVQLQDSSVPPTAAKHFASILRDQGLPITWVGNMKFERCLTDAQWCRHIGGAGGCRSLLMGFEAADQRLLDLMQKGYRLADLPLMLRNLRDAGVSVEMLWFLGFPTQTRADVLTTARWLVEHRHEFGMSAFVGDYFLHPDTEVFERPADFGVTILGQDNDHMRYQVAEGMQPEEAAILKMLLAGNNNRTLTCNGSHLPLIAQNGLELGEMARPATLPSSVTTFCTRTTTSVVPDGPSVVGSQ
jgi:anaerobic magnesium-protoporphyrin IX monomethyl ester cyclase